MNLLRNKYIIKKNEKPKLNSETEIISGTIDQVFEFCELFDVML
jgi:hypothetical protein